MAHVNPKVVLGMPFLTLNGADIDFAGREFYWKTYTTEEALLATRHVDLVGKKEFTAAALDPEYETYVVHIAFLSSTSLAFLDVHPSQRSQISGLIAKEALTKVPAKYSDFADVFSLDLASELYEHTGISDHAIELVDGQQPSYRPIYSLRPLELETLKAYIETNLANRFIRPSKSPAGAPILFDRKSDSSLRRGSYKGPRQVFGLHGCFLSGLGFRALRAHRDQRPCYHTSQWLAATLWTYL